MDEREKQMVALAEAIREWPQRVKDAGVKASDGRAYRPLPRNIEILRYVDDPPTLYATVKDLLNSPPGEFERVTAGWTRIVDQAGVELTWEYVCIDPDALWADLFTDTERKRVLDAAR